MLRIQRKRVVRTDRSEPARARLFPLLVALSLCHCQTVQAFSSHHALSTTTPTSTIPLKASVDPFVEGAPDLYKVLGASPNDSDAVLKRKWQRLARKLHPDANTGKNNNSSSEDHQYPYDISDINAAWGVLSNPKDRRKYDRDLQAKGLTDNFEALMDAGIATAIPFLQQTAKNTASAVDASAKVMSDVNKRVTTAAAIFDLDSERRDLEMKASRTMSQAKQIEKEIKTQDSRRYKVLQKPKSPLTSVDATKFLQTLDLRTQERPATMNEIDALAKLERDHDDKRQVHDQMERNLGVATKQMTEDLRAEERAAEKLVQAQDDLKAAQAKIADSQKAKSKAVQAEKDASANADKSSTKLNKQTEVLRKVLKRNEETSMKREVLSLESKKEEMVRTAEDDKIQAKEIKKKADELRLKAKEEERQARRG